MERKKVKNGSKTSNFGTVARVNHDSTDYYNTKLYEGINKTTIELSDIENRLEENEKNKLYCSSSEKMVELPDNSIHLMVTSPPYNVSKEYDDDLSLEEYLSMLSNVFRETYRVLVNGGRACINVANLGRKPYIPISDYISKIMLEIGFNMRGEIIWNKGAGAGVSMAWGSWMSASNPVLRDTHEYILVFSKGEYKRLGEKKESSIEKEEFMEWTKSIWTFNPESAKKIGHPAPFPEELPNRLIKLYSFKEDIILDPFMGSGTTAISALKNNRYYIGYDSSSEYVELSKNRIENYLSQPQLF